MMYKYIISFKKHKKSIKDLKMLLYYVFLSLNISYFHPSHLLSLILANLFHNNPRQIMFSQTTSQMHNILVRVTHQIRQNSMIDSVRLDIFLVFTLLIIL